MHKDSSFSWSNELSSTRLLAVVLSFISRGSSNPIPSCYLCYFVRKTMLLSLAGHFFYHHETSCGSRDRSPTAPLLQDTPSARYSMADSITSLVGALTIGPSSARSQEGLDSDCGAQDDQFIPEIHAQEYRVTPTDENLPKRSRLRRHSTFARTKTRLQFCYPPPVTKQRLLHARPKILLQLHRTSRVTRPTPTYDVFPATTFASRLAQEFPGTLCARRGSGVDDLAVVESENYSDKDERTEDFGDVLMKDDWNTRQIVAAISHHCGDDPGSSLGAEICLSNGKTWIGSPMPKGGYEFIATEPDGQRIVARWVPRRGLSIQSSSQAASSPIVPPGEKAFNFSLIDPHSRRHAVIATFDARALSISEKYSSTTAESTARPSTNTPETSPAVDDREYTEVDEALQGLIVATSIWVSYCEEFFGYDHKTAESRRTKLSGPINERRSLSGDLKGIKKRMYPLQRASSMQGLSTPIPLVHTPLMTPPFLTPPRRTQSTGSTAFSQLYGRPTTMKTAETLDPISDSAEVSQVNSRKSTKNEERGDLPTQDYRYSASEEKHKGRSNNIKKLYHSFKNSENGPNSP